MRSDVNRSKESGLPTSRDAVTSGTVGSARQSSIERVSAAKPCRVCGKPDWCSRAGPVHMCARTHGDEIDGFAFKGVTKDGVCGKYVLGDNAGQHAAGNGQGGRGTAGLTDEGSRGRCGAGGTSSEEAEEVDDAADLGVLHAATIAAMSADRRQALADELRLPACAIDTLDIGWSVKRDAWLRDQEPPRWAGRPGCWVFPERNVDGELIGLNLRFPFRDDSGCAVRSHVGRRGLTLPPGWQDLLDPVICVEGPSDVLAGRLIGLNCIGRPSNSGGADPIAVACRSRKVVILGENDRKPDGTWPGRDGARILVRKLQQAWGRPPHHTFPPDDQKDLRDWVQHRMAQVVAENNREEKRGKEETDEQSSELQTPVAPNGVDNEQLRAIGLELLQLIKPPPILLVGTTPPDRFGKVTVEARAESDDHLLHRDQFKLADAGARTRFANAVRKAAPKLAQGEDIAQRLMELVVPEDDREVSPPQLVEEDLPSTAVIRAGAFVTPDMAGRTVTRLLKVSDENGHSTVIVRPEFVLRHADGTRERTRFTLSVDDRTGNTFFIVSELPVLSPRTIRGGWRRDAQDRWLDGETPDIADVRDRLAVVIASRVWLPEDVEEALSLIVACFIVLTYIADALNAVPYLHVSGPKGSGKTQGVLTLFRDLAFRPLAASDVSPAVIFRTLDACGGTLILDEAEKLNSRGEKYQELTCLLNAGHCRGFPAQRCEKEGDRIVVREYDCYGPKVLASIARLPDTLDSRSIPVPMLRRPKSLNMPSCGVDVAKLRDDLHAITLTHALDLRAQLRSSDTMGLTNRSRDLWLPLIKIASWLDPGGTQGLARTLRDYAESAIAEAERECGVPEADRALLLELYARVAQGVHTNSSASDLLAEVKVKHPGLFDHWRAEKVGHILRSYGIKSKNKRVGKKEWRHTYHVVTLSRLKATLETYGVLIPGEDGPGAPTSC